MNGGHAWRVELTSPAVRDLGRIPPRYAAAIVEFLTTALPSNPPRVGKPLHGELVDLHSARRGNYRVLYRIEPDQAVVFVIRIDHRGRVYRSR